MGKVEAFEIAGVECWFWSADHNPPHFNAKRRGQWVFKVYFMLAPDRMLHRDAGSPRGRISSQDRRELCRLARQHRAALLLEWEKKVQRND